MADLEFESSLSGGKLLQELRDIRGELSSVAKDAAATKQQLAGTFSDATKGADQYGGQLSQALKIQVEQAEQLRVQAELIRELKKEMSGLKNATYSGFDANKARAYALEIRKLKQEVAELKSQLNNKGGKKEEIFAPGSIAEARANLKRLKDEVINLDKAALNSNFGKFLVKEIKFAEAELNKLEIQAGIAAKKTGNVFAQAFGGLRQIALLIPGIGLAGLLGGIIELIIEGAKSLLDFNKSVLDTAKLNEAISGSFVEAQSNVSRLTAEVALAKDGFINKDEVVKEYNNSLGKTIGLANNLDEVEKLLSKNAKAYIEFTLLKASANFAYQESAKKAFEAQRDAIKTDAEVTTLLGKLGNLVKLPVGQESQKQAFEGTLFGRDKADTLAARRSRDLRVAEAKKEAEDLTKIGDDFIKKAGEISKKFNFSFTDGFKEENKKRVEEFKDRSSQILALEKELANLRISILKDGKEKEIVIENQRFTEVTQKAQKGIAQYLQEIEKLNKSNKSSADKAKELAQLTDLINLENGIIEQEKITHTAKLLAIDLKYIDDAKKAFEAANDAINGVLLKDQEKDEADLVKKYKGIFKAIEEARKKNLSVASPGFGQVGVNAFFNEQVLLVTEKQEKDKADIEKKYSIKKLEEQENLSILENDILLKKGISQVALEELRETNKLNIIIDFAKSKLAILKESGKAEDAVQIAQLEKTIFDAEQKLKNRPVKEKSILSLLGIDFGSTQANKTVDGYVDTILKSTQELFSALSQIQQQQIDQSQKVIDGINAQIDAKQNQVDKEKELADQGYANNLGLREQELIDLQNQKKQEEQVLKEAQKKKETFQKAQLIADSVSQLSSLITAAAQIIEGFSTIPIVGVGLGIAAVAAMFAGFAASKVVAFNSIKKNRKGGKFVGPSHEDGGMKYISMDGNDIQEMEGGEYNINRDSTRKYEPLLDAVNKDRLDKMSTRELVKFLKPMGIHLEPEVVQNIVQKHEKAHGLTMVGTNDKENWNEQNKLLRKIAEPKQDGTEYFEGYRVERTGNVVRTIHTKK